MFRSKSDQVLAQAGIVGGPVDDRLLAIGDKFTATVFVRALVQGALRLPVDCYLRAAHAAVECRTAVFGLENVVVRHLNSLALRGTFGSVRMPSGCMSLCGQTDRSASGVTKLAFCPTLGGAL